jgi:diacylglycerol kinase family enzyme
VYAGTHLTHPAVRSARAAEVRVQTVAGALGLELDGEPLLARDMTFSVRPGLLKILS